MTEGRRRSAHGEPMKRRRPTMAKAALTITLLCLMLGAAQAQTPADTVRIGVLNDMSGVYSDDQGPGSLLAAQMAVEDFAGSAGNSKAAGRPVAVLSADHQNKADIGAQAARRWLDADGVDAVVDIPNSGIA